MSMFMKNNNTTAENNIYVNVASWDEITTNNCNNPGPVKSQDPVIIISDGMFNRTYRISCHIPLEFIPAKYRKQLLVILDNAEVIVTMPDGEESCEATFLKDGYILSNREIIGIKWFGQVFPLGLNYTYDDFSVPGDLVVLAKQIVKRLKRLLEIIQEIQDMGLAAGTTTMTLEQFNNV